MTGFEWINWLDKFDRSIFLFINGSHRPWLDPWMIFASEKMSWIPLYVLIFGTIFYQFKLKGLVVALMLVLSVIASDQFASGLLKPTVKRLRPCHNHEIQQMVYLPTNHCGGEYGFVSSHAANHFAVAAFLFLLFFKKYRWVASLFLWAFWIAYSRIYMGVHYPGDVIVGALVGIFFGWSFFQLTLKIKALELANEKVG